MYIASFFIGIFCLISSTLVWDAGNKWLGGILIAIAIVAIGASVLLPKGKNNQTYVTEKER